MFTIIRQSVHRLTKQQSPVILALALSGCSSMKNAVLLGGGVGVTTGALVGQAAGQNTKSTVIGGALGGIAGGLIAFLAQRSEQEKQTALHSDDEKPGVPKLTDPRVKRIWVPDRVEADRFEAGHYLYVIDKPVTWTR